MKRILRIGITGHRTLVNLPDIEDGLTQACVAIHKAFPYRHWRVYSQLAEGADRIVFQHIKGFAQRHGDLRAELAVVLPLSPADYQADFFDPGSKIEFTEFVGMANRLRVMPPAASREQAYQQANTYVLQRIDVLLVVWDGKPEQGLGGTGEIVRLARKRGLPLAWVHAGNRLPGTMTPTNLGKSQGKLTLERFPVG